MKVSLNWLKEYINLKGIEVEDIVEKLTMSGLEVEDVINQQKKYENFVVGFVKEKQKHPNADKLSLCKVSTGSEEFQVICGAPNVDAGQKIVFAKVGAVVPKGNFKIGKAKIRGIESYGMICSEAELELSENHEGIMVLSNGVNVGEPIAEALQLNDVIFEIAITPNRPDALSHFGVARDLAALYNLGLTFPEINIAESLNETKNLAEIIVEDGINCPRYSSRILIDVEVKDSPDWLKRRLTNIGLRPINNIVDVSNFVMYECGQPLHAFDLDLLSGKKIVVKSIKKDAVFTTLDSKERKLPQNTLMICDAEKEVAIAGVMGGENSEISPNTKNILIESAYFNPSSIRRTAKALGMSTEASYRFERGIDPNNTMYAADRAAQLIAEISVGTVTKGKIDVYPNPIKEKEIKIRYKRVSKVLGYEISQEKIGDIFNKLGFNIIFESDMEMHVLVPTFRPDIDREIDLIEEVARINGYDNIPTISKIAITLEEKYDETTFADDLKNIANSLGFSEMITNPLQGDLLSSLTGNRIPVLNPQSADMAYLRTSLLPGALDIISKNIKVGEKNLYFFELGNIFNKKNEKEISDFADIEEVPSMILILTGKYSEKTWHSDEKDVNFFHLKGFVNSFLDKFMLDNPLNDSYYHEGNNVYEYFLVKKFDKTLLGSGGRIKKEVLKHFDIEQEVFAFEFNLEKIKSTKAFKKEFKSLLRYPKVIRDFAFIFESSISYDEVKNFIEEKSSNLLKTVSLFDLFESDSLGNDKKSMAFSLEFYSGERTLTEEEVEKEFAFLIKEISNKFEAKLRGS